MNIIDCIGNTPLIQLPTKIVDCSSRIFIKMEEFNFGGSIKARVGYQMIIDAENEGKINKRQPDEVTILEATGGNTGIGIAQICALRGYHCVLIVPDNYSQVRVNLLREMGAEVIYSDHRLGNDSHFIKAKEIQNDNPDFFYTDQTSNFSNVKSHYLGTGREIIKQIPNAIDFFISGIGSGGTITGIGKALKEKFSNCQIVAVQPEGCDVMSGFAVPHIMEGFAIGKIPKILELDIINQIVEISNDEVAEMKKCICRETGLYLGFSSIANILGSIKIAKQHDNKTIVTISPDGGRNYN